MQGRPKGPGKKTSLEPVAERLSELLGQKVQLAPDCVGAEVDALKKALQPGQVLLLENVRWVGRCAEDCVIWLGWCLLCWGIERYSWVDELGEGRWWVGFWGVRAAGGVGRAAGDGSNGYLLGSGLPPAAVHVACQE